MEISKGGLIGCISTPSIMRGLKRLEKDSTQCYLLEYDKRFKYYGEQFIFYDYNCPLEIPSTFHKKFDFLIVDPPFLSRECFEKVAQTVKLLVKNENTPILFCTGAVMEQTLVELFPSMKLRGFKPEVIFFCHVFLIKIFI